MQKRNMLVICLLTVAAGILSGCGNEKKEETDIALETYEENGFASSAVTFSNGTIQFKGETSKDEVYDFGYSAADYISAGDYSSVKVQKTEPETVTEDDVQAAITERMKNHEIWTEKTEGSINRYDLVNLDITCTINGEEYTAACKKDINLNIGSGNYFPELEEQIIGKQIGDIITIELTLPDNTLFTQQAGKKGTFTVHIKAVRIQPQLTDEIVAKLSDHKYQSTEEYRQYIKTLLESDKKEQHDYNVFMEVMTQIADSIEIKEVPEVETEGTISYEKIQKEAEEKGVSASEIVQEYTSKGENLTISDNTKETYMNLLLLYIADQRGITVTGEDICSCRNELIEKENYSEKEIDLMFTERRLAHLALNKKVLAYVAEHAEE